MIISDSCVKDVFFKLESDGRVFDYRIKNVSLYFILRFSIELYFRDPSKPLIEPPLKRYIKRMLHSAKYLFTKTHASAIMPSEFLFVSTSDWTDAAGESVELVDIIKYYKSKNQLINFVQPDFTGKYIHRQPYHDNFIRINTKARARLNSAEKSTLKSFLKYLSGVLQRNYEEVYEPYADYTAYTFSMATQLEKLIRESDAKVIFARSIYTEPWVLIACNKAKAKCIEVQHGAVHPDSVYYQSSAGKPSKDLLFPEYILTVGEEWRNILLKQHNHYSADSVLNLGCRETLEEVSNDHHSEFEVLICLQHGFFSIDDILVPFFHTHAAVLKEARVTVKLRPHPHTVRETMEIYKGFEGPRFRIINSRAVPFHDDLETAALLVSPSSMCLYEAIAFGIPTASFERFKQVSIGKELLYCESPEQLFQFIMDVRNGKYRQKKVEYLSPFNPDVLEALLLRKN
jgi:hypothetical protein